MDDLRNGFNAHVREDCLAATQSFRSKFSNLLGFAFDRTSIPGVAALEVADLSRVANPTRAEPSPPAENEYIYIYIENSNYYTRFIIDVVFDICCFLELFFV